MKKATKDQPNKSQLIRDFVAANPALGPTEIAKALAEQGHKIYPALVSQALRRSTSTGKSKAKRGRKPGTKNVVKAASTEFDLTNIKAAAAFVRASGGVDSALSSIKSFQKIVALLK